jgi:hypothetical protein
MSKSVMQELIDELESIKNYKYKELTIRLVKEKLEKEKEQIINAHLEGWSDAYDYIYSDSNTKARQAEDYYSETYKK